MDEDRQLDEAIDEAEDESFPASDPQSSWAGPDPSTHPGTMAAELTPHDGGEAEATEASAAGDT